MNKNFLDNLATQHYSSVPFNIDKGTLEGAANAFFEFLEEPDSIKSSVDFSISKEHRRGDIGYKKREGIKHLYEDKKEFFHFHPRIFTSHSKSIKKSKVFEKFLLKALPIWHEARRVFKVCLSDLEKNNLKKLEKIFNNSRDEHILLRFLKYNWANPGKHLAKPHYDAGAATLAIAESKVGLRIGSCEKDLKLINYKSGYATFMLSRNYKNICNLTQLQPGWHDVIRLHNTFEKREYSRWAIVAFIDALNTKAPSRKQTHSFINKVI